MSVEVFCEVSSFLQWQETPPKWLIFHGSRPVYCDNLYGDNRQITHVTELLAVA